MTPNPPIFNANFLNFNIFPMPRVESLFLSGAIFYDNFYISEAYQRADMERVGTNLNSWNDLTKKVSRRCKK